MAGPKLAVVLIAVAALAAPVAARAATLQLVGTYESPVYVASEPTDASRVYVVEQPGTVKLTTPQGTTTFLDLTDRVLSGGERGLFSIAFPGDYATSGLFYVLYTRQPDGDIQLDEYRASGNVADATTRRPLLTIEHSLFANHNGGQLQFGPDGYLYLSTGDGGGGGDPLDNGQDLAELLGKVLRIDPQPTATAPYSIPADNPFAGTANDPLPGARDEIWSYGLRNPWRFSFDRVTGALVIGDVGQGGWEEIDYVTGPGAGRAVNFGWDCREGRHDFELAGCPPQSTLTDPIFEYPNPPDGPASVTGGYVVRDLSLGSLEGRYLYADVFVGEIRSLIPAIPDALDDRSEGLVADTLVSFGEDAACGLYVVSLTGPVYRLAGDGPPQCPAGADPPPGASEAKAETRLTLRAKKQRIAPGNRARLKVRARPCPGRADDRVELRRGGERVRAKRLNGRCRGRFAVRIRKPRRFRAVVRADEAHLGDRSNRVEVRIRR